MRVWFTCKGCGVKNAPADIPDRGPGEDIADWMPKVQCAFPTAHHEFSPRCRSQRCDLKIPVGAGTKQIGEPVREEGNGDA